MENNQKNIHRKRTNEELKIAHINGKYVLIAALITGIFTFFAAVIGNDAGRERANNEAMSQVKNYSIDVTNLEELIDKYNQLSDENNDLKDKNSKLNYNNSNLKEENHSILSQNETLLAENDSLKNQLIQYSSLEEENKALVDENNLLNDKIKQLENEQGNINGESPMPTPSPGKKVSVFDLDTFKGEGGWFVADEPNLYTDTYGNEFLGAYYVSHSSTPKNEKFYLPTYLLDNKYSICEGQIAWPKKYKNYDDSAWIEFYSGDECIYTTDSITSDSKSLTFSFSVNGIEKLTIVTCGTGYVDIIYSYLNLVE